LFSEQDIFRRLLGLVDGERRVTNLMHLVELLHTKAVTHHLGPNALIQYLGEQRQGDTFPPDSEQVRLESDEQAVTLTTMHKSKGLEYPIVYLPHVGEGLLEHPNDRATLFFHDEDGTLKLDLGSDDFEKHRERFLWEKFAENLRVLYVALTRAKHQLNVFLGPSWNQDKSPLGYALFPPRAVGFDTEAPPETRQITEHLKSLSLDAMASRLEALCAEHPSLGLSRYRAGQEPTFSHRDSGSEPRKLRCKSLSRPIPKGFRTGSFTSLAHADPTIAPHVGRDWDEWSESREAMAARIASKDLDRPILLRDFPRGAKAGNFFHELLEEVDFSLLQAPESLPEISRRLGEYGYDAAAADVVQAALKDVLKTPLEAPLVTSPGPLATGASRTPLSLGSVPKSARLAELEFHLPVGAGSSALTSRALSALFRNHPSPELPARYADDVAQLGFEPLRGFLKGYIDLVFEHEGRFFVVDYKTNHLGDTLRSYAASELQPAMASSHYYLQYHLYALALHRYLGLRLRDYDYDRHFGGVYYLFLKGMHPDTGRDAGIFYERPPIERIAGLSQLLEGEAS
jgi:exodeoxyribonuclease V beta subunit